jgi:hypothetical protein
MFKRYTDKAFSFTDCTSFVVMRHRWCWVRFQPESRLPQWYQARFGQGSACLRQLGLVALARKPLMALWRFLKTGDLPVGAVLKAEASG